MSSDRAVLFAAATGPRGVTAHRPGALERVQLLLDDFRDTGRRQSETEACMVDVLDELHLTELVCSIASVCPLWWRDHPGRERRPDPLRQHPGRGQSQRVKAGCREEDPASHSPPVIPIRRRSVDAEDGRLSRRLRS